MTNPDALVTAFWAASPDDRARILEGIKCGPFGETPLQRAYAEALIVFQDTGDMAKALELVPPEKNQHFTFRAITENPNRDRRISTLANRIRKRREKDADTNAKDLAHGAPR